jgi:hypothetical protein
LNGEPLKRSVSPSIWRFIKVGLKKYVALAVLASPFLFVSANAQYVNYRVTKAAEGLVLVWESPGNEFTLEVKGEDVSAGLLDPQGRLFFKTGGIYMTVQPAMISEFVKPAEAGQMDTLAILKAHMDWEARYVEIKIVGKKLDVKAMPQKLPGGRDALLWEYEVPNGVASPFKRMVYLTVRNGDKFVLMLNCQLKSGDQVAAARRLLLNTGSSIKPTATPQDGPVVLERKQKPE